MLTAKIQKRDSASLLIKGGHLIDPAAKINAPMDILLRDGRVAEVALPNKIRGGADETFDARGLIVAPGFIDLHVHLREPGQGYKETIATAQPWSTFFPSPPPLAAAVEGPSPTSAPCSARGLSPSPTMASPSSTMTSCAWPCVSGRN